MYVSQLLEETIMSMMTVACNGDVPVGGGRVSGGIEKKEKLMEFVRANRLF